MSVCFICVSFFNIWGYTQKNQISEIKVFKVLVSSYTVAIVGVIIGLEILWNIYTYIQNMVDLP